MIMVLWNNSDILLNNFQNTSQNEPLVIVRVLLNVTEYENSYMTNILTHITTNKYALLNKIFGLKIST
jgi:hypothetical protein